MAKSKLKTVRSSGNIFEDLGFDKSEAISLLFRADLMFSVAEELRRQKKTQAELGQLLGIGQSRVSDLMKGKAKLFSLDMLVTLAERLGMSVKIAVGEHAERFSAVPAADMIARQAASLSAGSYYDRATLTVSQTTLDPYAADVQSATVAAVNPLRDYFRSDNSVAPSLAFPISLDVQR